MIFVNDIPHLKYHKLRTYLPRDNNVRTMYSVVMINNSDYNSSIDLMKNPMFFNDSKYNFYYMDFLYKRKFISKAININIKNDRQVIYDDIEDKVNHIRCLPLIQNVNNRNLYFDLFKYNEYFFKLTIGKPYMTKMKEYVKLIKDLVNDSRFSEYKYKTVFINVENWIDEPFATIKKLVFDNPIIIFYILMKKDFATFSSLGDIDFIIYNNKGEKIRLNPSLCDDKSHTLLRRELVRLTNKLNILDKEDFEVSEAKKQEIFNGAISHFYDYFAFTGDESVDAETDEKAIVPDISEELDNVIKAKISEEIDSIDITDKNVDELVRDVGNKVIGDEILLKQIFRATQELKTGKPSASIQRDETLRDAQKNLKIKDITFEEIRNQRASMALLDENDIASKIKTTNMNMTKIKYPSFEKVYNDKLFKKDLINSIMHLNDKDIPIYIRDVKVEDSSNELNYKETYKFELEDANRVRHHLTFDVPKFIDGKFMYLGGNRKIFIKQLFLKPIVKTGPDEVQICTNYNKVFIYRYGAKLSPKIDRVLKALTKPISGVLITTGDNSLINNKYKTTIEYDQLAKYYLTIKIKNFEFAFNQDDVTTKLEDLNIKLKDNEMCVGFIDNKIPILMDTENQYMISESDMDLVEYMIYVSNGAISIDDADIKVSKKYMYNRCKIIGKWIPIVVLMGFWEGLSTVIRKAGIKHYFSDKKPKDLSTNQATIQFADGYLVYDIYPIKNSLLMNGLNEIPTKAFNYSDLDSRDTYISLFDTMYNSGMIAGAFKNAYDFLIDPITKEVLEDLNYPTECVELFLMGNELLADSSFFKENNLNLYRIRSNEIINVFIYKAIYRAYQSYELTSHSPHPVKISIPKDKIIKDILTAQNIEDYSTLNPITEAEKSHAITPKGLQGLNVSEAYDQAKRSYDKTMMGILAISTSPDRFSVASYSDI